MLGEGVEGEDVEEMEEEEGDDDVLDFEYEFDDDDDDGADYDLSWRKFSYFYSPPYRYSLLSQYTNIGISL